MLYPLIRIERAIALTLINPNDPIKAVAVSEIASVFGPLLIPVINKRIIVLTAALVYYPRFAYSIIECHNKQYKLYNQIENMCLIILIISLINIK